MQYTVRNEAELTKVLEAVQKDSAPAEICFNPGVYRLTKGISLSRGDLTFSGEGATLSGALRCELSRGTREGKVVTLKLSDFGITDTGRFGEGPYEDFWRVYDIPKPHMCEEGPGLQLFYEGNSMSLARYPKTGFLDIAEVYGTDEPCETAERGGASEGIFFADDARLKTFQSYDDILLMGYWCWDWATQRHTVADFDRETGRITVNQPYHTFGYRPNHDKKGGRFYLMNVKEALENEGEWCIDRRAGTVSLIPYKEQTYVDISSVKDLFFFQGQANIKIQDFTLTECRECGVRMIDCTQAEIASLTVHQVGAWGILGENCTCVTVRDCFVSECGGGGIGLAGGDRASLTPSCDLILRNTVTEVGRWHRTYMAAIEAVGVGVRVAENKIYRVPHFGIVFSGNDILIEKNEITDACYESHDAGAIYSGRDFTYRGTVIRYNHLHHLHGLNGLGCRGIYFDDCMSSAEVYGNVFSDMLFTAIELGGGRDFKIHDNVFLHCKLAVMYDDRGIQWARLPARLLQRLGEVPYQSEAWEKAYPELAHADPKRIFYPEHNAFVRNLVIGGDGFAMQSKEVADLTYFEGNTYIPDEDPTPVRRTGWYHFDFSE